MAELPDYHCGMDEQAKQDVALFRLSVLGALVGAELEHGDVAALCREAAERRWERPDGTLVRLSARSIETWLYAYRHGGFAALLPTDRKDLGTTALRPELADLVLRAKRERPRRSLRSLIKILVRAGRAKPGELSRSSVHRLLARHQISSRPLRGPSAERRSFLHELAGELLVGDALHPRRKALDAQGRPRKIYLLSQLDCATRYIPESYFAFNEDAPIQEHGLKQVLLSHGRWRRYYVDRGPAYIARSLKLICAELDMRLLHTGKGDAEAKGCIERWHKRWREEFEDELPDYPLPIAELQAKHRAWLACDYHVTQHDTTGRLPGEHWLELCHHLRSLDLPPGKSLDDLFLHRAIRTVNATGTIRWGGGRLEVSPELEKGREIELRFDPFSPDELPRIFVDGLFFCDTVPLDLFKNAHRKRRRDLGKPDPRSEPTGISPLDDLVREHQRLTTPLAFLAEKERPDEDDDAAEE